MIVFSIENMICMKQQMLLNATLIGHMTNLGFPYEIFREVESYVFDSNARLKVGCRSINAEI